MKEKENIGALIPEDEKKNLISKPKVAPQK